MPNAAFTTIDLPSFRSHAPLPKGRQFYGAISGRLVERDLALGEVIHSAERTIPSHTHETAYYDLVVAGGYEESHQRGRTYFQPFSSAFNRSGTRHEGRIAPGGARFFTVEIGGAWIRQFLEWGPQPETVQDTAGGELTCLGSQLYREYRTNPAGCALIVEALIWELLAIATCRDGREVDARPHWWGRVLDLLHSEFKRDLRISEVAQQAGVHPVHLARVFRRICNQTPGEYLQRLRVRFASERLSQPDAEISAVAAEAGFADQSHLTRIFRRYTRMTPGEFRRAFAPSRTGRA